MNILYSLSISSSNKGQGCSLFEQNVWETFTVQNCIENATQNFREKESPTPRNKEGLFVFQCRLHPNDSILRAMSRRTSYPPPFTNTFKTKHPKWLKQYLYTT